MHELRVRWNELLEMQIEGLQMQLTLKCRRKGVKLKFSQLSETWLDSLFLGYMMGERSIPLHYATNCKVLWQLMVQRKDVVIEVTFDDQYVRMLQGKDMFPAATLKK